MQISDQTKRVTLEDLGGYLNIISGEGTTYDDANRLDYKILKPSFVNADTTENIDEPTFTQDLNIQEPTSSVSATPVQVVTIIDDYKYIAFTNHPIDPALIVHYKFDDNTNAGLNSSSYGSALDATTNGSPIIVFYRYIIGNSSYFFSGAGDDDALVVDSNSNKLNTHINNQSISIAFWCFSLSNGQGGGRIFMVRQLGLVKMKIHSR